VPSPSLQAKLENGIVTLSGVVPDENTKTKILTRAAEVYGADKFTDNLKVGNLEAGTGSFESGDWTTSVLALLPFVNRAGENSKLTITGNTVALMGQVSNEAARAALRQELSSAAGDAWNVAESVIVEAPSPPSPPPPATSEATLQQATDHTLETKAVEFFMGSDVVTAKGREVLNSLVPLLRRTPDAQIEIAGHADNVGTEEYNQTLSQRRAEAVRRYFIGKGISTDRITTQAYGASRPIADNSTVEGRWRNRRTEIVIHSATTAGN
jgi:OOP family OmpA-OmpF porin